ncbi:MAG: WXG100 family type VII secretion target [Bacilli bacterium]|nr:WXG100 family type VII secretion target [Bacilli bacterium]
MDLKINYEETRRTGKQIQSYASEFNALLADIKGLNDSLKSSWKGADADSYTGAITEQANVMDKLKNSIDEIGKFLVSVGDAYERAMEENKVN